MALQKIVVGPLPLPTSGATDPFDISDAVAFGIWTEGAITATYKVSGSPDGSFYLTLPGGSSIGSPSFVTWCPRGVNPNGLIGIPMVVQLSTVSYTSGSGSYYWVKEVDH